MVSSNFIEPLAEGYLLMTNILSTLCIDKLTVPEVIETDSTYAALECAYSGASDDVTVRWLLNGSQVYEWSAGREPSVSGVLAERVDLSYRTSAVHAVQKHTLRIVELGPELSGDYTCVVLSRGQEARLTKTMIIFSPEHEFELSLTRAEPDVLQIKCVAKHLHPEPDLTIEYNKIAISQQQQRIWRFGAYYDAECTAVLSAHNLTNAEVACRLQIPQVDYTVITKKYVNMGSLYNDACTFSKSALLHVIIGFIIVTFSSNISS